MTFASRLTRQPLRSFCGQKLLPQRPRQITQTLQKGWGNGECRERHGSAYKDAIRDWRKSYSEKGQSVFAAFPVFATFDACVEVIDVDAVPSPNHELVDNNGSIFARRYHQHREFLAMFASQLTRPGGWHQQRTTTTMTSMARRRSTVFLGPSCYSLGITLLLSTQMVTTTPTKSWHFISRFAGTWSVLNSKRNSELAPPVKSAIQFIGA